MNFGTPVPLLLGIFLVLSSVLLFFLENLKPGYGRDADKVFAVLFLLSGVFLLSDLQMNLLHSFQQLIMVGMLVTLMIQTIQGRTPRSAPEPSYGGGRDGYGPPRPRRDPYPSGPVTNVRAELDMRGGMPPMPPERRPERSRPMLEGRGDRRGSQSAYGREGYRPDEGYPNGYSGNYGPESANDGGRRPSPPDGGYPDEPGYYPDSPPRDDGRVRRRRPSRTRGDSRDRYRLSQQGNPERPDYPPPNRDY